MFNLQIQKEISFHQIQTKMTPLFLEHKESKKQMPKKEKLKANKCQEIEEENQESKIKEIEVIDPMVNLLITSMKKEVAKTKFNLRSSTLNYISRTKF